MDPELVVRARGGDTEAFSTLAANALGRLNGVARLILHDVDRADDAVQDALVNAWRDLRGLREPARFQPWLDRLLVRACYRAVRRDARRRVVEIAMPLRSTTGDAQDAFADQDQLMRALRRLGPEHRAAIVVTYYLDLPLTDAAAMLDIPVGTMKSRLSRALAAMRAAMDADERVLAPKERYA